MARIQDIKALEERIGNVVEEYLQYPADYTNPVLKVWFDTDTLRYEAAVEDATEPKEDTFPIGELLIDGSEPDYDRICETANGFLFIE